MIDAGWYSCVAMLLSSEKPRKMYLKAKRVLTEWLEALLAYWA